MPFILLACTLSPINSRDHPARGASAWHVCGSLARVFLRVALLPRRMMMMAELVQGQASVAQPATKDDFADTIRRVRQVKCPSANTSATLSEHESRVCG